MNAQENNKLIAEFMELPLVPCNIGTEDGVVTEGYQHPKVDSPCTIDGLQYKYSWDWLMPVVKKCLDVYHIEQMNDDIHFQFYDSLGDIKLTYQAVVEFINQYNKNK